MNKSIFLVILILICANYTFAQTETNSSDVWQSVEEAGKADGQKPVTDNTFNKTIQMLKERQLTHKQKKEQRLVQPLSPSSSAEHLKDFAKMASGEDIEHTLTVMIPVFAYTEIGELIAPGYYKLSCKKTNSNGYVLQLSQDLNTVYTIFAIQTEEDLQQETINFCNAELSEDNRSIKLVYGNLGLNLVGYIYVK